jgi:type II secretory pathway pseudopilin PulG
MKRLLAVLVVLLAAGAFVAGYWPQRQARLRAEKEAAETRRQLADVRAELARAETQNRRGLLFGRLLALQDAVANGNFGEAQTLSTPFFDGVRDEAVRASDGAARTSLDAILMRRDTVTAGIARGEGSVRETLLPIERELRRALGYPLPALPSPRPAPAEVAPSHP